MPKSAIFVYKSSTINMLKIEDIVKLGIIVIMQANIEVMHITYVVSRRIWRIIYLLRRNAKKYITFTGKYITIKFIDSERFKRSSLSNLVNNIAE